MVLGRGRRLLRLHVDRGWLLLLLLPCILIRREHRILAGSVDYAWRGAGTRGIAQLLQSQRSRSVQAQASVRSTPQGSKSARTLCTLAGRVC